MRCFGAPILTAQSWKRWICARPIWREPNILNITHLGVLCSWVIPLPHNRMLPYSRYIISWQLFPTMSTTDVQKTLVMAVARTGIDKVKVKLRPRLLSDNGPCYLSKELKTYLDDRDIKHIRSAPYHPQTQGKIERYHRSIKNVITLHNYYFPTELEQAISEFVNYYNNKRYHESLNNLTPVDVFHGRSKKIISTRKITKKQTLKLRRYQEIRRNTRRKS